MKSIARRPSTLPRARAQALLLACLLIYLLAYLLLRLALPACLELDEAEITVLARHLALGYGSQPPLYAWLQWASFQLLGENRLALLLPKTALILATYLAMYRMAAPLVGVRAALVAAASLALIPEIGWDWLVDRTHTILATALACATLATYFALVRTPDLRRYLLLGLLAGLGLQAKYNTALFLFSLAAASLLTPEHRRLLWNRKLLLAAGLALLLLLPHGWWLAHHFPQATASTLGKLAEGTEDATRFAAPALGLLQLLLGLLELAGLLLLVCLLAWAVTGPTAAGSSMAVQACFFGRLYAVGLSVLAVLTLTGLAGNFRARWLLPLLFSLPLALLLAWPALRKPAPLRLILCACLVVSAVALAGLPLRAWRNGAECKTQVLLSDSRSAAALAAANAPPSR